MFISERLIYLELPKTACSHIRDLLQALVGGEIVGKHNPISLSLCQQNKCIIGSIRNPWDWYISLWAFGCDGKGSLYKRLISRQIKGNGLVMSKNEQLVLSPLDITLTILESFRKSVKTYRKVYSDSKDSSMFREWLKIILDLNSTKKYSFGDGYAFSPISSYAGLYTYYYIRLFSKSTAGIYGEEVATEDKLVAFDRTQNSLHEVIRIENLEEDLVNILKRLNYDIDESKLENILKFKPDWHKNKQTKTNSSSRVKAIEYYYDQETSDLVAEKEKFIIKKYGYVAPEI